MHFHSSPSRLWSTAKAYNHVGKVAHLQISRFNFGFKCAIASRGEKIEHSDIRRSKRCRRHFKHKQVKMNANMHVVSKYLWVILVHDCSWQGARFSKRSKVLSRRFDKAIAKAAALCVLVSHRELIGIWLNSLSSACHRKTVCASQSECGVLIVFAFTEKCLFPSHTSM